jgi:hypothetical protein
MVAMRCCLWSAMCRVFFVFCVDLAGASALKLCCSPRAKEDRRIKKARRIQIARLDEQQNPENKKKPTGFIFA